MNQEDLYIRTYYKEDGTFAFIRKLGGDPENIAGKVGLEKPALAGEFNYTSWATMCHFYELTSKDLNDPDYGLKWAMNTPEDLRNIGPALYIVFIAKNIGHLTNMLMSYFKIFTNGFDINIKEDLETDTATGVFAIHPLSPPCRQYCEHVMGSVAEMARRYISDFKLIKVTFQYSEPEDITVYEQAFQCPVHFNADQNTMVLNRSYLGMKKKPLTLQIIKPLLNAYLKRSVERNPHVKKAMSHLIVETLPAVIGVNNSDLNAVAKALELHPKKLQRLLAEEGSTYSDLLDQVRSNLAKRLLVETDISIDRIAKSLDYSTDRAFTAAAKRWFGKTPTQYRKHMRTI